MSGNTLADRVGTALRARGESFAIAGGPTAKGSFQVLSQSRLYAFFDDVERAEISRPGLVLHCPADVAVSVGNTIARDGRTYTVKRLFKVRCSEDVVMQVALLA